MSPRPSLRTRRRTAGAGAFAAATLLLMPACRPEPPVTASDADDSIPLDYLPALHGDYFELQSEKVGRPFHIYVRFPERYESEDARYPVVYLLDGDSLFPILASNHLFLSYDEGLPEALVVGIAYGSFDPSVNKRSFDFSAAAPDGGPDEGGAPAFVAFTSGSRDRPELRQAALEWYDAWKDEDEKPWSLDLVTIEGGTHAADSANSYRAAMLRLFSESR